MNKFLIAGIVATTLTTSGLIANQVFAQEATASNPMTSIAQKLAQKFNLNQDEVQAVFDETRQEHQAVREAELMEQLDQQVAEGSITTAQKDLIVSKHQELQSKREADRESFQGLTRDEKRAQREAERQELAAWADANDIDLKDFMFGQPGSHSGRGKGMGQGRGFGR